MIKEIWSAWHQEMCRKVANVLHCLTGNGNMTCQVFRIAKGNDILNVPCLTAGNVQEIAPVLQCPTGNGNLTCQVFRIAKGNGILNVPCMTAGNVHEICNCTTVSDR